MISDTQHPVGNKLAACTAGWKAPAPTTWRLLRDIIACPHVGTRAAQSFTRPWLHGVCRSPCSSNPATARCTSPSGRTDQFSEPRAPRRMTGPLRTLASRHSSSRPREDNTLGMNEKAVTYPPGLLHLPEDQAQQLAPASHSFLQ